MKMWNRVPLTLAFVGLLTLGYAAVAQATTITLTPPSPNEFGGTSAADGGVVFERGDFISALNTFSITSLGIEADPLQALLTFKANIYAATGTTRGALLATNSVVLADAGQAFYDVPIAFTFLAGNAYDIAIDWPTGPNVNVRFFNFDPATFGDVPFNVGPIRVVDGEGAGNPSNFVMPNLRVETTGGITAVPEPATLSLLGGGLVYLIRSRRRNRSAN